MTDAISAVLVTTVQTLPTCTYNNGTAGVGATLTASSVGTLTVDTYTVSLGDRIAVAWQASPLQNGIYSVTTLGNGSTAWVLTRTTDFDTPAKMNTQVPFCVLNGDRNLDTMWCSASIVTTIGTDNVELQQLKSGFIRGGSDTVFSTQPYTGIGNSSPTYTLDVEGTSRFNGTALMQGEVVVSNISPPSDSTTAIRILKADESTIVMDFDTTNGRVGIGNSAPAAMLDVGSSGSALGTVRMEGNTSGYVQLQPAAAAGSWTMTLPSSAGTSGDVLQTDGTGVASWVAPSGGGGLSWQAAQTSAVAALAGDGYPVNTTSGAITLTLPASPSAGNQVGLVDYAGTFGTNNLTINPNGLNINGSSSNQIVGINRTAIILTYVDATQGWLVTSQATTPVFGYSASYLVVAGGGAGGYQGGGGGGAGGLLAGTQNLIPGQVYTVIVGAGGAATTSHAAINNGSASSFGNISTGGGGGGSSYQTNGAAGGSGGGAGTANNVATLVTGGAGTAGQGYAGGNSAASQYTPGSGAGAGAAGGLGTGNAATSPAGGVGASSSITGSAVTYAGGGGAGAVGAGGNNTGGAGGAGGGGAGSTSGNAAGTAGTANTGGGGGGGGGLSVFTGGAGGSGVVILSVPTANYSGTTTGSPTVTTSGGNTILKFTSSGSYTG